MSKILTREELSFHGTGRLTDIELDHVEAVAYSREEIASDTWYKNHLLRLVEEVRSRRLGEQRRRDEERVSELIECERDCIVDGDRLTAHEKLIACEALDNLLQRIQG